MQSYGLSFISDKDLFDHAKATVQKYRSKINLLHFNKNLLDPIKLTFDTKIYKKPLEELIESEVIRQIDKSNNNLIGYFHQNIFKYMGDDWTVLKKGFDIANEDKKIFVEMKNKHNTMNSSSSQKTYMRMQAKILLDREATCMLVEVIAKNSQNIIWKIKLDDEQVSHEKIRRVSIDKFYHIVTCEEEAFSKLCAVLPKVIDDAVSSIQLNKLENTVLNELKNISSNLLQSIYLLAFKKYEGFENFEID